MFILHTPQGDIAFIHIPKTAGMAIRMYLSHVVEKNRITHKEYVGMLGRLDASHIPFVHHEKYIKLRNPYYFTCVRNPYDRVYSAYEWVKKTRPATYGKIVFTIFVTQHLSNIVKVQLHHFNTQANMLANAIHLAPMYLFVTDRQGKQMVTNVIRQEELNEKSFSKLQQYGLVMDDFKAVGNCHSGAPPKPYEYLKHYTRAMLDIVNTLYAKDFEMFGYQKK